MNKIGWLYVNAIIWLLKTNCWIDQFFFLSVILYVIYVYASSRMRIYRIETHLVNATLRNSWANDQVDHCTNQEMEWAPGTCTFSRDLLKVCQSSSFENGKSTISLVHWHHNEREKDDMNFLYHCIQIHNIKLKQFYLFFFKLILVLLPIRSQIEIQIMAVGYWC